MKLNAAQRRDLLQAERSHVRETIADAISEVLERAPGATFLDAEMTFRDAGASTFLVVTDDTGNVKICIGVEETHAALDAAHKTPAENRAALAEIH